MKKIFLLLLSIPLFLTACAAPSLDVGGALAELLKSYGTLPIGNYYETADGGISETELLLLYDPDDSLPEGAILSAALYLGSSFNRVFELALFDCAGSDAAMQVSVLCHRRADFLKEFDPTLESTVIRYGEYVFFAAAPSVEGIEELADRVFQ